MISFTWMIAAALGFLCLTIREGIDAAWCVPFVAAFLFRIFKPFQNAYKVLTPEAIRGAVKSGILSSDSAGRRACGRL